MYIFKTLANRQLTEYSGSDKYINVSSEDIFNNIFNNVLNGTILTINNKDIRQELKGSTTNIHFVTYDKILNKTHNTFLAKGTRELRYQLTRYIDSEKIIPGDIISIFIDYQETNCDIQIKSESLYKYVLERKSQSDHRYRLLIEQPNGSNNAGIIPLGSTNDFLSKFGIEKLDETTTFGRSQTQFTLYSFENCNKHFIGIPYDINLECDCFDNIEEIL
jgi:hypothetical protein